MIVKGYEMKEEVIKACLEVMLCGMAFRVSDIKAVALKADPKFMTPGLAERLADRLVQQERKSGKLKQLEYPFWVAEARK